MTLDDEMRQAMQTFVTEAQELCEDIEQGLLRLESAPDSTEDVNALFRAVHTLKGSAGLFGLDHLVAFAHVVESVLESVRVGDIAVVPELVNALLPCADHLGVLVADIISGRLEPAEETVSKERVLLVRLNTWLSGSAAPAEAAPSSAPVQEQLSRWRLDLQFGEDSLRNGMDPLAFLRYLGTLGTVTRLTTSDQALPAADAFDPESSYLHFTVELLSAADQEAIAAVFDFVREDSVIEIVALAPLRDVEDEPVSAAASGPSSPAPVAVAPRQDVDATVQSAAAPAAAAPKAAAADGPVKESQSIRVDAERLDRLIDLVGELVIAQASAGLQVANRADAALLEAHSEVMRLVEEVRGSALSLRMVPIGTTFRRFERVVRDVSADLGKDVALILTGSDAEVDKALVERIGDPLMHLVRNSLDHGIETPEERAAAGKPARGSLRLNAFHHSGSIVIEVTDDGKGLDRERILAKAAERGLVEAGASLTEQEVFALIFEAGFSTADKVSNLSGRGVGMDVVRRNVTDLRGTIEVESTLGVGTTMRIRLPLTLAIIDGFLVGVGDASFVIPLDRVTECVELPAGPHLRDCIDLRGAVLPFIRLRNLFGVAGEPARRQNLVVVEHAGQRTGLVVDQLMGEFQTVIKPLGALFSDVRGISGSTILGNGEAALILDVAMLVAHHVEAEQVRQAS